MIFYNTAMTCQWHGRYMAYALAIYETPSMSSAVMF